MAEAAQEQTIDINERRSNASGESEPGLFGLLIKDLAVVFAALSLWAAADTWSAATGLLFAEVLAVGDGLLVGVLLGALFHEWGHYAGAKASGAVAPRVAAKGLSLFRYNFKFAQNDLRQFHWMTYGGHIGHWSVVLLLAIALPIDTLSRIALISGAFAFVAFASSIEFGILKDTHNGADPLTRLQALNERDFRQAYVVGTLAGLFALALLS